MKKSMAATLTVHSPSHLAEENITEVEDEETEEVAELVDFTSPAKNNKKRLQRQGSVSENFFAVKGASLILPRQSSSAQSMEVMQVKKFGGDLQTHLYAIFHQIRPQDNIKLAVRLESWAESRVRYLVIVTTFGRQDTEESIIVGMDFLTRSSTECTLGLVIPIWSDTTIKLDGDGGFKITGRDRTHTFKPVSVQAMWSALQAMHKCVDTAQQYNYYYGSLFLTWICYYQSRISSPRLCLNEWEYCEEHFSRKSNFYEQKAVAREDIEWRIRCRLKEVMMKLDLDNCTTRDIREGLEKATDLDLTEYKSYVMTEMLTILGQMDVASKITDYLYLGSEWNASNDEENSRIGISHILNITMEIDNFFPDNYIYKNILCYDEETTDLLQHWYETWKFIKSAKRQNGKCLVHCKMGISRSAASVAAFLMKEYLWSMEKALSFVKDKRSIVQPNKGFMRQLQIYEGILKASAQRHNNLFRSRSESNLSAEHSTTGEEDKAEDTPPLSNVSNSDAVATFDLNRRLLDLTVLPYRPSHTRPKSWSPDDAKHYYADAQDFLLQDEEDEQDDLESSHMSEPQSYFTPIEPASRSKANRMQPHDKRRKWKRRHTEKIFSNHTFSVDNSQSEDSVFANPGEVPPPRIDSWMIKEAVVVPQAKRKVEVRLSSPAAIQSSGSWLEVDETEKTHSSLASPMNSPSFKITKNVSVSSLKSRFSDESILRVEMQDNTESSTIEDGLMMHSPEVETPMQLAVRDIVAEIESPTEERSGTATAGEESVTEADVSVRERSFSENQVLRVKSIVSEIESRYTSESSPPGGSSDDISGKENTESEPLTIGISRSQSLPSRRKKPPLSPPLQVLPVIEDKQIESDSSPLKSLDKNMNLNNNNNNINLRQEFASTTVIEIDSSQNEESTILKTISQPGCSITERLPSLTTTLPAPSTAPYRSLGKESQKKFVIRTLTQSELQVIREVGKTFLSDSEETNSILSNESSSITDMSLSSSGSGLDNPEIPLMKRGVVRRMARIFENRFNQDQEMNMEIHTKPRMVSSGSSPTSNPTDSTIVINKLLMGEPARVEERACDPAEKPDSLDFKQHTSSSSSMHEGSRSSTISKVDSPNNNILSLAGPTPYSPAHTTLTSRSVRPIMKSPAKGIRRTQSERSVFRPIKVLFQGPKVKQILRQSSSSVSHPILFGENLQNDTGHPTTSQDAENEFSFQAVKDIVQSIERSGKKEVNRASSFHDTRGAPVRWSGGDPASDARVSPKWALLRTQSNPNILQDSERSHKTQKTPERVKTRLRKKGSQTQFRIANPLYQTM